MANPPTTTSTPAPPTDLQPLPQLRTLATLPCPLNGRGAGPSSRAWQATPHPSPSAPLLAVASADRSVYIWSLRNFQMVSKIEGGHKRSVRCVEWKDYGGDGSGEEEEDEEKKNQRLSGDSGGNHKTKRRKVTLATGSFDANVGVWQHARAGRRTGWSGGGGVDQDQDVDVQADDDDDDNQEDGEEWNFTTLLTGPDSEIKSMHFSPSHYSANLLATSSRDKSVWVWEEVEDEEWETVAVLQEHQGDVKCVRWCEGVTVPVTVSNPHYNNDDNNNNPKKETRIVGSRELLASGSYDDTIRLWRDVEEEGDWTCIALLEGHQGTVWDVSWEKWIDPSLIAREGWDADWEPRLISCSDDLTLRVWRRELSETEREKKRNAAAAGVVNGVAGALSRRLPSIIRPTGYFETWLEEARLPQVHVRSVYAVDWSRKTGLVVSCAGDGTIAVYKEVEIEVEVEVSNANGNGNDNDNGDGDVVMAQAPDQGGQGAQQHHHQERRTKWIVVAVVEAAHDEYEVNHVCWATRRDADARAPDEEVIVSTGDEGDVKLWLLPEDLLLRRV